MWVAFLELFVGLLCGIGCLVCIEEGDVFLGLTVLILAAIFIGAFLEEVKGIP
jgi:hypothetical protein